MYLLSFSWNHYLCRESTMNLLSLRDFTIVFPNSLWIHYLFREITINSLSFPQIYYDFTHCFRKFTLNELFFLLRIHYLFREFTMDWLSISRRHYRSVIFVIKKLWIHYLLRESTTIRVFLISHANSLRIHQRIHFEFTINFAISLWIYHLSGEFTMNLFFLRISNEPNLNRFDMHFTGKCVTWHTSCYLGNFAVSN